MILVYKTCSLNVNSFRFTDLTWGPWLIVHRLRVHLNTENSTSFMRACESQNTKIIQYMSYIHLELVILRGKQFET